MPRPGSKRSSQGQPSKARFDCKRLSIRQARVTAEAAARAAVGLREAGRRRLPPGVKKALRAKQARAVSHPRPAEETAKRKACGGLGVALAYLSFWQTKPGKFFMADKIGQGARAFACPNFPAFSAHAFWWPCARSLVALGHVRARWDLPLLICPGDRARHRCLSTVSGQRQDPF